MKGALKQIAKECGVDLIRYEGWTGKSGFQHISATISYKSEPHRFDDSYIRMKGNSNHLVLQLHVAGRFKALCEKHKLEVDHE